MHHNPQLTTHNSQLTTRVAIFPGTFDPFTIGHDALVHRALNFVDELYIAIGINTEKRTMLTLDERIARIKTLYEDDPRVHVVSYEGLTTDFAQSIGAQLIIRGVRNTIDFEYERNLADVNRKISGIETVILFTLPEHSYVSSSMVRELQHNNYDVADFIP